MPVWKTFELSGSRVEFRARFDLVASEGPWDEDDPREKWIVHPDDIDKCDPRRIQVLENGSFVRDRT